MPVKRAQSTTTKKALSSYNTKLHATRGTSKNVYYCVIIALISEENNAASEGTRALSRDECTITTRIVYFTPKCIARDVGYEIPNTREEVTN